MGHEVSGLIGDLTWGHTWRQGGQVNSHNAAPGANALLADPIWDALVRGLDRVIAGERQDMIGNAIRRVPMDGMPGVGNDMRG